MAIWAHDRNAKGTPASTSKSPAFPCRFSNGLDDAIQMLGFLQGQTARHRTSLGRRKACRVDHRQSRIVPVRR
jgi:hypothetical protein